MLAEEIEPLGDSAREILLRVHDGSKLTHPQTAGGCFFWFLDGSVIGDSGPRELQARELIAAFHQGETVPLTEQGRSLAERLKA